VAEWLEHLPLARKVQESLCAEFFENSLLIEQGMGTRFPSKLRKSWR